MNDRIKIAEAMGYAFIPLTDSWLTPCGKRTVKKLPDPFTSADDDYACWSGCGVVTTTPIKTLLRRY